MFGSAGPPDFEQLLASIGPSELPPTHNWPAGGERLSTPPRSLGAFSRPCGLLYPNYCPPQQRLQHSGAGHSGDAGAWVGPIREGPAFCRASDQGRQKGKLPRESKAKTVKLSPPHSSAHHISPHISPPAQTLTPHLFEPPVLRLVLPVSSLRFPHPVSGPPRSRVLLLALVPTVSCL